MVKTREMKLCSRGKEVFPACPCLTTGAVPEKAKRGKEKAAEASSGPITDRTPMYPLLVLLTKKVSS